MKLLLYCTKAKPYIYVVTTPQGQPGVIKEISECMNGHVIGECDFDVERIFPDDLHDPTGYTINSGYDNLIEKSCLTNTQLDDYLQGESGYAIHIKNLKVYDKFKGLNDYMKCDEARENAKILFNHFFNSLTVGVNPVTVAPQNMMYVSADGYTDDILISIRPEWIMKIVSGEKKIEVRKKVLNSLKKAII